MKNVLGEFGLQVSQTKFIEDYTQVINIERGPVLSRYTWLLRGELSLNSTIYFPRDFRQVN